MHSGISKAFYEATTSIGAAFDYATGVMRLKKRGIEVDDSDFLQYLIATALAIPVMTAISEAATFVATHSNDPKPYVAAAVLTLMATPQIISLYYAGRHDAEIERAKITASTPLALNNNKS